MYISFAVIRFAFCPTLYSTPRRLFLAYVLLHSLCSEDLAHTCRLRAAEEVTPPQWENSCLWRSVGLLREIYIFYIQIPYKSNSTHLEESGGQTGESMQVGDATCKCTTATCCRCNFESLNPFCLATQVAPPCAYTHTQKVIITTVRKCVFKHLHLWIQQHRKINFSTVPKKRIYRLRSGGFCHDFQTMYVMNGPSPSKSLAEVSPPLRTFLQPRTP